VRDVLYVTDLVRAFDAFVQKRDKIHHGVYNIGGGIKNTLSLLELLEMLEDLTGKRSEVKYDKWRAGDQKVYISDVSKAKKELGWAPTTDVQDGIRKLIEWIGERLYLFDIPR